MNKTKALKRIINLRTVLWVNAFCYYFSRLWLIGKLLPVSACSNYKLKNKLSVIAFIVRQVIEFIGKPLYLLTVAGLPLVGIIQREPGLHGQEFALTVQILFFLNCLLGALGESQILMVTRDKITYIKYMNMNARSYVQGALILKYVPFFVFYLPWIIVVSRCTGGTFLQGFFLWLMLVSFRMIGEALQLSIFDRTEKVISRNMAYSWILIGICLAGAYVPPLLGIGWDFDKIMLNPLMVIVYTFVGAVCCWYVFAGYSGYEEKLHRSIDINFLLSTIMKSSTGSSAAYKEVEIKEKDRELSARERNSFQNLKGYAYMNALFFARHKRQLIKPVYYRLLVTGVILAASVFFCRTKQDAAVALSRNLTALLPTFVFVMSCMTVADKAARAMFYNCDKDMLHYACYRTPQVILKNFRIRLMRISLYNMIIAGVLCAVAAIFCILCGTGIMRVDFVLFSITILLLSVLFTAHHLCMYYIFQPYSDSLQVKNPFFSVINWGVYVLCFLCLEIETGGVVFTVLILLFTVIYIAAALALVYKLAPKTFRVK